MTDGDTLDLDWTIESGMTDYSDAGSGVLSIPQTPDGFGLYIESHYTTSDTTLMSFVIPSAPSATEWILYTNVNGTQSVGVIVGNSGLYIVGATATNPSNVVVKVYTASYAVS